MKQIEEKDEEIKEVKDATELKLNIPKPDMADMMSSPIKFRE